MLKVGITNKMMTRVRQSNASSKHAMEQKKQQQAEKATTQQEERKRKVLISRLEQQKLIMIQEIQTATVDIEKQLATLKLSK